MTGSGSSNIVVIVLITISDIVDLGLTEGTMASK